MEVKEYRVGIADLNVAKSPDKIITVGLGSCIGIALYDKINGIGGLLHIMLPDSTQFKNVTNPLKFADLGIPILIDKMKEKGANVRNLKAKISGGASMFNFSDKSMIMDIGRRNIESVKKKLNELSIPILAEEVGGNKGRTMILDTSNGVVQIKTVGVGIKEI
ncbi:chemotaxis protein CheD [Clostridium cochlearium]|jgi:chemotaxis protein CheD|uniref:Probable chemoreceptor glutamine deamidase CheD n=1 Tax=Clostridium cochlearium TaxID=1494 RepID=A0ABY0QMQ0_CLOCO|nr:chemotaxis protein CheD [Clostridium cochlearium]MBV1819357.1 chemotaxis protein CheD [Bacteroidales bacterium MSK.15.36]NSJ91602.1 chemotaxis protein CheD [Coprococcus sp. MSK.21.13]MBE6064862.1 chemotaxis protein CheD [Clostridium cochlearium]MBU5269580.1 chemotaxis protein CheD [Clostridium cochlearium]MCG4571601.1 chemotaxis protein CheD [Clostridium cochlearium]